MRCCAAPTRSSWSTSPRKPCETGSPRESSTRRLEWTRLCRTTSASVTSPHCGNSPCCGSPTRSTARSRSTGRRRASPAPGTPASGWLSHSPAAWRARRCCGAVHASPRGPAAARCSPCTSPPRTGSPTPTPRSSPANGLSPRRSAEHTTRSSGEQIPRALVDFARSVDATQLVIGVSRRSTLARLFTGPGTAATVIRDSGDIDVHIVSHSEAGSRRLPTLGGALSVRRRIIGVGGGRGRAAAAHHAPRCLPERGVHHQRCAGVPALRGDRRADRRNLAGRGRGRRRRVPAGLLLRRPAVHDHHRRAAAPARTGDLRRRRRSGQHRGRPGGPALPRSVPCRRRVRDAFEHRRQRAQRAGRAQGARSPGSASHSK